MEAALYPQMAAVEDRHWWFAGRRAICASLLDRIALPDPAVILEAGCGTGGNFAMLAGRGTLYAIDSDQLALELAAVRGLARLQRGALPGPFPFGDLRFDLVVMTDVLEHLDDERGALKTVRSSLKPRGWLLLTVPALSWLWSGHDDLHHHRRRYQARGLRCLLNQCGFQIEFLSYYNFLLFPAIGAVRLSRRIRLARAAHWRGHDLAMPPRLMNWLLFRLFSSERFLLGRFQPPLGVSLIVLAHT